MFQHYIAIFRERPSAFWEMLNWEAVDRLLWMGMLCLVTWCALCTMSLEMDEGMLIELKF
jgi:hypothetical protein